MVNKENFKLTLNEATLGANIDNCITDALRISRILNVVVHFTFNNIEIRAFVEDTEDDIKLRYKQAFEKHYTGKIDNQNNQHNGS